MILTCGRGRRKGFPPEGPGWRVLHSGQVPLRETVHNGPKNYQMTLNQNKNKKTFPSLFSLSQHIRIEKVELRILAR
jgi:hypothetical protein